MSLARKQDLLEKAIEFRDLLQLASPKQHSVLLSAGSSDSKQLGGWRYLAKNRASKHFGNNEVSIKTFLLLKSI
ncbi:hypothetical protein quinque_015812 [Culex quinquefasciatus]